MAEDKRNMALTKVGYDLMSKTIAGEALNITKIVMGDGVMPQGISDIKDMTTVVSPRLTLPAVDKRIPGGGVAIIDCQLNNAEIDEGFFCKEIGVYAKDPDTGDEVLYSYRNTENYPDWIPAAGSNEVQNQVYTLIIVIGQIENVNITITEGIGSVSRAEYYNHLSDTNPHPQFLQVGVNKVKECVDVWVGNGEQRRFLRMSIEDFRKMLAGGDISTLPNLEGRLSQVEMELMNIGIENMIKDELNLSNMIFYEDFSDASLIDNAQTKVNAISAGSNTIGVESLESITQGSWYTITDGVLKENIQVASMQNNDELCRIITKTPIVNTYNIQNTMLYRSTAGIRNGKAYGSADRRATAWKPTLKWSGEGANTTSVVELDSTLSKAGNFRVEGDAKFTADGFMTLDTTIEHSHGFKVELKAIGGGKGTWSLVDEKGVAF